jgi:hypothetical protein
MGKPPWSVSQLWPLSWLKISRACCKRSITAESLAQGCMYASEADVMLVDTCNSVRPVGRAGMSDDDAGAGWTARAWAPGQSGCAGTRSCGFREFTVPCLP